MTQDVNGILGDARNAGCFIEESGFGEQRKTSVGVARQWLGRLGKVDNGQVTVFGALAKEQHMAPEDGRLYLPLEWADDPKRCERAGIPVQERKFRTKTELALELVRHARQNRFCFGWSELLPDTENDLDFVLRLVRWEKPFCVDVYSDFRVYLEDPKRYLSQNTDKLDRPFTKYQNDPHGIEVRNLVKPLLCEKPRAGYSG